MTRTGHEREIIGRPLTPSALADLRPDAQAIADALVDRLVERSRFDAVTDLAEFLPASWVPDLLGWPADGRDQLVAWAAAQFDGLGPLNDRAAAASEGILAMSAYAGQLAESELPEDCFGARIQRAAEQGEIDALALPDVVHRLPRAVARHDDQRDRQRRLAVRHASGPMAAAAAGAGSRQGRAQRGASPREPDQLLHRVANVPARIGEFDVPAGSRVLLSFASANRDERRWEDPERFDITRQSASQLAFGHGEHACVGMGLARLEGVAVLEALVERVATIELDGPPVRKRNNLIRSFASLPVAVTPARAVVDK